MTPSPAALALAGPGWHPRSGDGGLQPDHGRNTGYSTDFLGRRSVRDTWIAIWVLWIVWAMLFLAKQTFGPTRVFDVPRSERVITSNTPVVTEQGPYDVHNGMNPAAGDGVRGGQNQTVVGDSGDIAATTTDLAGHRGRGGGGNGGFFSRTVDSVRDRIDRTYNLIRDLTLMLLVVVTLNTFGLGSSVTVLILAWIYLAIALFWAGITMLIESRVIDIILGSLQMLILLAILVAAYAIGWTVLY
ncbi:hypothetical protein BGZ96_000288 [Linnemannia gamsii]|uniref:Uncharacterized protein n=1 Tax=Linnemannia gamsii TaxID=64522 RepID=A0ABQ7KA38_9FUNG|nr:hypothetical protein BGZ96_000288 [Linnemannia gamsii]